MSPYPSPWSDPATDTEPGAPYAGPPPTTPYRSTPGAPYPAAWQPPWPQPWIPQEPPVPARPERPGQVIAAAVLAFAQAIVVAVASGYVRLLGTVAELAAGTPGFAVDGAALATEADVLAVVQLVSLVGLVAGGVLALTRRTALARWTLVAALALQLALAAYWAVRPLTLFGGGGELVWVLVAALFAAAPAAALGLAVGRPAREWFAGEPGGGTSPHR